MDTNTANIICNSSIKLWTLYGFNFEHNFVQKVFKDEGEMMVKHLQGKFDEAYRIAGMYGSFFYFWSMLDSRHQRKLQEWVLDNYKG